MQKVREGVKIRQCKRCIVVRGGGVASETVRAPSVHLGPSCASGYTEMMELKSFKAIQTCPRISWQTFATAARKACPQKRPDHERMG